MLYPGVISLYVEKAKGEKKAPLRPSGQITPDEYAARGQSSIGGHTPSSSEPITPAIQAYIGMYSKYRLYMYEKQITFASETFSLYTFPLSLVRLEDFLTIFFCVCERVKFHHYTPLFHERALNNAVVAENNGPRGQCCMQHLP